MSLKHKLAFIVCASIVAVVPAPKIALAENADLVFERVQLLEKELAAVKRENEALRQIKRLREENASLAKSGPRPASARRLNASSDPREAYAADMPIYSKAPVPLDRGLLKLWGEGGAVWSGGDPIFSSYNRFRQFGEVPESFALTPKPGWEVAAGFDYRFSASPWHVSGQFRYGESRTSESRSFAQSVLIPANVPFTATTSDNPSARLKETHWLTDLAVGRDVIGSGPEAMQFKFGVRVAELRADVSATNPRLLDLPGTIFVSLTENASQQNRFFGAGPRLGLDGSVPMGRGWAFDYLGDVAALFGTQKFQRVRTTDNVVVNPPAPAGALIPIIDADQTFATVFNADIQVGVSYWMSQNVKLSASYRLDAYFNVFSTLDVRNDPTKLQKTDRYIHGPRLAVTAQF